MALPSKHAPLGLSREDASRVITVTRSKSNQASLKSKEESEVRNLIHKNVTEDVDMVDAKDSEQVRMVSDFVANSRMDNSFSSVDGMDLDKLTLATKTVYLQGNISYLVIDTNFILSHLHILDGLRALGSRYGLVIVFPVETIRELDGLKVSARIDVNGEEIAHLARDANTWIYESLAASDPCVKGQSLEERIDRFSTKDDAILDCCLYLRKNFPQTLQILMSNDKNLCMKALSNQVLTISYVKGMTAELIASRVFEENVSRFGHIEPKTAILQQIEVPQVSQADNPEQVFQTIFLEVSTLTKSIVHQCLVDVYGEDIGLIRDYDKDSLSSIVDVTDVISRFWVSVFSESLREFQSFGQKSTPLDPELVTVPSSYETSITFIEFWYELLEKLYQTHMPVDQMLSLERLHERWQKLAETTRI